MCELCNPDTRQAARKRNELAADRLEHLARRYRDIASGTLAPHSKESGLVGIEARNIIRDLVEDWL